MYLLAVAEFAVNVARGLFTLTLGMLLYKFTKDLWAFTFVYVSEFVIAFFLHGLSGAVADRFGARKVLLVTLSILVSALLLLCIFFREAMLNPIILIGAALALNISKPFIVNAVFVLTANISKATPINIERITGVVSVALQSGQILGMVLAGIVIEAQMQAYVIPFVTAGFAIALIAYFNMAPKCDQGLLNHHTSNKNAVRWLDALNYIKENPKLALCIIFGSLDFVTIAMFNLLLAPVVMLNYGNEGRWLTIIDVSFALGAIAGGFYVLKNRMQNNRFIYTLFSLSGAFLLFLFYAVNALPLLVVCSILAFGFLLTLSAVGWSASTQEASPDWLRGRISAVRNITMSIFVSLTVTIISVANEFGTLVGIWAAVVLTLAMIFITLPFFQNLRKKSLEIASADILHSSAPAK